MSYRYANLPIEQIRPNAKNTRTHSKKQIRQIANSMHMDFEDGASDPAEEIPDNCLRGPRVTQTGDRWCLGKHRLLCEDARNSSALTSLVDGERAHMAFLDPPYNVAVRTIVGRGKAKHPEFPMASGEMSPDDFIHFLNATLEAA